MCRSLRVMQKGQKERQARRAMQGWKVTQGQTPVPSTGVALWLGFPFASAGGAAPAACEGCGAARFWIWLRLHVYRDRRRNRQWSRPCLGCSDGLAWTMQRCRQDRRAHCNKPHRQKHIGCDRKRLRTLLKITLRSARIPKQGRVPKASMPSTVPDRQ